MPKAETKIDQKKVSELLNKVEDVIGEEPDKLPERLWTAIEGYSSLPMAYKQAKGKKGWARTLVDLSNQPLFSPEEADQVENILGPILEEVFVAAGGGRQDGGGAAPVSWGPRSSMVQPPFAISPDKISMDLAYKTIFDTIDQYDEQWHQIASAIPLVKGIESTDYVIPLGTVPVPVPGRLVLPLLNGVLELLRLGVSNNLVDIAALRVFFSIGLALLDLVKGEWKDSLLSLLGIAGKGGVYVGFFGKLFLDAWSFIAPDIQKQLRKDLYRSGKSAIAGFILWSFSLFAPAPLRLAAEQARAQLVTIIDQINTKIEGVEAQLQPAAAAARVKVSLPRAPLEMVPSLEDIENLQTIVRQPAIFCSPDVQPIFQKLILMPPLRLVLELMNIPTLEEDRAELCRGVAPKSLAESIASLVDVKIEPLSADILDPAAPATPATPATEAKVKGGAVGSRKKSRRQRRSPASKKRTLRKKK